MTKKGKDASSERMTAQGTTGKESKLYGVIDAEWEDMDVKAAGTIELCLADEVMYNIMDETMTARLWLKLESLYMTKNLSNKFYLKKQLYYIQTKVHPSLNI